MSAWSARLPESLHKNAKDYAAQEGVSVSKPRYLLRMSQR